MPQLRFRPLGADDMAAALEQRGFARADARAVAATADGSLGRALATSAGELVEAREVAQRVLAHAAASDDPRQRIEGAKICWPRAARAARRPRTARLPSPGDGVAAARCGSLVNAARMSARSANVDVQPVLERLARTYQGERGIRAFTAVDRALMALERNAGVKVVADWLVLHL